MKTLIIYARPCTSGHCPHILKTVEDRLKKRKEDYEIIDLYKLNYDPVLKENEHYTSGNYEVSKQNKKFQEKIKEADNLMFIYPVWWGSMPAIMKGFFDRVFVGRFAFKFKGKVPVGLLKGKKAAVLLTTGAHEFFNWIMGSPGSKLVKKFILDFCGIKTKVFVIGNSTKFNEKQGKKIGKAVDKAVRYLY